MTKRRVPIGFAKLPKIKACMQYAHRLFHGSNFFSAELHRTASNRIESSGTKSKLSSNKFCLLKKVFWIGSIWFDSVRYGSMRYGSKKVQSVKKSMRVPYQLVQNTVHLLTQTHEILHFFTSHTHINMYSFDHSF